MDKINADNGKCYEENRTRKPSLGGGAVELRGIRRDFSEGDS